VTEGDGDGDVDGVLHAARRRLMGTTMSRRRDIGGIVRQIG
jgi:hypothetical protein